MVNRETASIEDRDIAVKYVIMTLDEALYGIEHAIQSLYAATKLRIDGNNGMYIWIALTWDAKNKTFLVDISNITIDSNFRRHGVFTKIITKLMNSECVHAVRVSNVLTDEMHLACKSLNMDYISELNSYQLVKYQEKTASD